MYDGKHLLIVQFKAKDVDEIKSPNCSIDCCILARTLEIAQCTARYALYRLVWRGWMRMTGEWSNNIPFSLSGWDRKFRFWSGRPYWENQQTHAKEMTHPHGYYRIFAAMTNMWYWVDANGNVVLDANGNTAWDSFKSWA